MVVMPDCDFCQDGTSAAWDAPTVMGPWAHMCEFHLPAWGRPGSSLNTPLVAAE